MQCKGTVVAPSGILNELAVRVFTGSRDVPKDNEKARQLFGHSEENAKTENEQAQVMYYQLLMRKFKIHQETVLHGRVRCLHTCVGIQMSDEQAREMEEIHMKLEALANSGNGQA